MSTSDTDIEWIHARRAIIRNAISVGVAVATYGVGFGALGTSSGFSVLQTCALSLFMFTGASQFTIVSTVAAGGTPFASVLASLLVGSRNAAYAIRMNPILQSRGLVKIFGAHLTIDESTAMALAQDDKAFDGKSARLAFWSTGISVFVFWNIATFLGAFSMNALGDPKTYGIDAAIAAGLFALVWPQIKNRLHVVAGLGGALVAITLSPVLPAGVPILAAGLVAVLLGYINTRSTSTNEVSA